jgi:hypothetical protein
MRSISAVISSRLTHPVSIGFGARRLRRLHEGGELILFPLQQAHPGRNHGGHISAATSRNGLFGEPR